jgi:transcriptional regulator with XRE-family HTH domain
MQDLDKAAMGRRIRQIRLGATLRQWELAKLLGTTQSAVHKYEHGVVPEPRRLVELARIGGTSIEWVLTGRHWENGSQEQPRISPELLETACLLREISDDGRASVNDALRIIREAVQALDAGQFDEKDVATAAEASYLRMHASDTLKLLHSAHRIQRAVLQRVARDAGMRLGDPAPPVGRGGAQDGSSSSGGTAAGRS